MERRRQLLTVVETLGVAALTTAVAVAINVATKDGTSSWWPAMEQNPVGWTVALTAAGAVLPLLVRAVRSRMAAPAEPRAHLLRRVQLVENEALEASLREFDPIDVPLTTGADGAEKALDLPALAVLRPGQIYRPASLR